MSSITVDRHARTASRTMVSGESEQAMFIEVGGDQVYTVLNLPKARPSAGLVICSPFFAEFARNYRREVLLARALGEQGVAVARFHHRGFGNSSGDPASVDLDRMSEDAAAAADELRARGANVVAFHGTRLSAFTAAAAGGGTAPVSLWEPVADGRRYFNEVFRTRMAQAVHDSETDTTAATLKEQLDRGASVDVLGHSVHGSMYASLGTAQIADILGGEASTVQLVQLGRPDAIRKELTRLAERLTTTGHRVELTATEGTESWWVANRRADYFKAEEHRPLTTGAVAATSAWIRKVTA